MLLQQINIFKILPILALANVQFVTAQVYINNTIEFNSDSSHQRQIENLSYPSDTSNAVKAEAYMAGFLNFYTTGTISNDTISLTPPLNVQQILPGMRVNFIVPVLTNSDVFLKIQGFLPIKLVKKINTTIKGNELITGTAACAIFDGTNFQYIMPIDKKCPSGFIEVNEQFCIELNENSTPKNYFNANIVCQGAGNRLCKWGEWYYACQKTGLGISNMTNNFEWVDSAANGSGGAAGVGNLACTAANPLTAGTSLRYFRCCYSK